MNIFDAISSLVNYGLENEFFEKQDRIYYINKYMHVFNLDDFNDGDDSLNIRDVIDFCISYCKENNLYSLESMAEIDNFDAFLMDVMLPKPSEVTQKFFKLYTKSPKLATSYFYDFSILNRYIRVDRLANNIVFKKEVNGNNLDITINLSKPEKDPKEIARLKTVASTSYPKCALCVENEGFYGTLSKAARSNHRIIPINLNDEEFGFQYSPYGYFNEHCIVLKQSHEPMSISPLTFKRLLDFVELFPHYFLGSNADLPIVGGSILSHEHYQGGCYTFPEAVAPVKYSFEVKGYEDVECGIVAWPMSVVRLTSECKSSILELATRILEKWRKYSDEDNDIIAFDGEYHNTITPIARVVDGKFQLDLVLRNNRTSKEFEDGIFHPHKDIHHIKKENIGLIEVMGLAVLPGRLKNELAEIQNVLLNNLDIPENLQLHNDWILFLKDKYQTFDKDTIEELLRQEVAVKFNRCLIDAGVYKENEKGFEGFKKFVNSL
ncbi:MAG: UDP-glucose--hexose-1-phosphate uridylyltransferase [Bacilli bacterium]